MRLVATDSCGATGEDCFWIQVENVNRPRPLMQVPISVLTMNRQLSWRARGQIQMAIL